MAGQMLTSLRSLLLLYCCFKCFAWCAAVDPFLLGVDKFEADASKWTKCTLTSLPGPVVGLVSSALSFLHWPLLDLSSLLDVLLLELAILLGINILKTQNLLLFLEFTKYMSATYHFQLSRLRILMNLNIKFVIAILQRSQMYGLFAI